MSCRCKQFNRSGAILGRMAHMSLVAPGEHCANRLLAQAFHLAAKCEHDLGRHLPCSDLNHLCRCEVGVYVPVPERLWQLLRTANDIAYKTDGVFDVVAAGSENCARWTDLDLSQKGHVRLRRPLYLSLGGLLRGYVVDLVVQALREMGVGAGLVDIGGCIRAFGPRSWRVEFRPDGGADTKSTSPAVPIVLQDGALAGIGSMFTPARLLDTGTGIVSSTAAWADMNLLVRASNCATAQALSVVAAISPGSSAATIAPFGAEAIVLTSNGAEALSYAS